MLVDAHTHVFPPELIERREDLCRRDPAFAELYANPAAKLARPDELLAALDRNDADHGVALGFAWSDPELCRRHNDALLEAGAATGGRIVPFCIVNPAAGIDDAWRELERCAAAGARGVGELRPDALGLDLDGRDGDLLARAAEELGLVLLFHASEPVGHTYPGKHGGELGRLYRFIQRHPAARVVCAHWGGGLPFFALMPEVRRALANTWFDTAATTLLYETSIYRTVIGIAGAERILFGSDFPLLGPLRQRRALLKAKLSEQEQRLLLGENTARLLGLPGRAGAPGPSGRERPQPAP